MKIAIIGYGKMGHAIERIALGRGHEIVAIIDADNLSDIESEAFRSADVAIEFTTPSTAVANVERAASLGVNVVCGSTGWYDRLPQVSEVVCKSSTALMAASNFSIGVHVFNNISRRLSHIMNRLPQYTPVMSETHHVHKLDHPSGTALTIAEGIIGECDRLDGWADAGVIWEDAPEAERKAQEADHERLAAAVSPDKLAITTYRRGEVPGIHEVKWESPVDEITLCHSAKSRDGFALGAVMAAEWIAGRKGVFSISDMMDELLG